jgi:hypothetical protein
LFPRQFDERKGRWLPGGMSVVDALSFAPLETLLLRFGKSTGWFIQIDNRGSKI